MIGLIGCIYLLVFAWKFCLCRLFTSHWQHDFIRLADVVQTTSFGKMTLNNCKNRSQCKKTMRVKENLHDAQSHYNSDRKPLHHASKCVIRTHG